jgi:AbrB family looped-hinge helix DNA binding protein
MTYSSTITTKGQVTIPVTVRRKLGLKPGESVHFKLESNNRVTLEKNDWQRGLNELHREVAAHLKKHHIKPLSDEELDEAINKAAEEGATEDYLKDLEQ